MENDTLAIIADLYSPFLVLATALTVRRQSNKARALLAIGVYMIGVYGMMLLDNHLSLWPRAGMDYSTHTAFAAAYVWFLWRDSLRLAVLWPTSLLLYLALMHRLDYHSVIDMVSTLVAIAAWIAVHDIARSAAGQKR